MVSLSADLPYALGKVGINYTDDGISVNIKTKKDNDNKFSISGSFEGVVKPLSSELIIQSKLLCTLLRSFASKQSVKVSVSDIGLGVTSDSYSSVIYTEVK